MTPQITAKVALALAAAMCSPTLPNVETAKQAGRPVVCFVACEPLPLSGIVLASQPSFADADGAKPRVLVCAKGAAGWFYVAIPAESTEAEIRAALAMLVAKLPAQAGPTRNVTVIPAAPASRGGSC